MTLKPVNLISSTRGGRILLTNYQRGAGEVCAPGLIQMEMKRLLLYYLPLLSALIQLSPFNDPTCGAGATL